MWRPRWTASTQATQQEPVHRTTHAHRHRTPIEACSFKPLVIRLHMHIFLRRQAVGPTVWSWANAFVLVMIGVM